MTKKVVEMIVKGQEESISKPWMDTHTCTGDQFIELNAHI